MRILYIRNFAGEMNLSQYNSQEIGLCKNFVDDGYDCDIIYYTRGEESTKTAYEKDGHRLRVKTQKAIKIFSNAVYLRTLWAAKKYDIVIVSEFHQIMSMLMPLFKKRDIYIYHGTYKDENHLIRYIPGFVIRRMNASYRRIFAKSVLAKDYLEGKGFDRVQVVGVGLDTSKFKQDATNVNRVLDISDPGSYLLYVGEFCQRKNTLFLLEVLSRLENQTVKLVLIGKSKEGYMERMMVRIRELSLEDRVVFTGSLSQDQLSAYYKGAEAFLLPSSYEIFGMVLLECMHFGTRILTSKNGGSTTLFGEYNKDIIVDELDVQQWADRIDDLLREKETGLTQALSKLYEDGLSKNNWKHISRLMSEHF